MDVASGEAGADLGMVQVLAAVMHAVVVAECSEARGGLGEAAEDVLVSGIVTDVRVIDVVAGEADEVGVGGNGEVGDVVEVMEGNGGAEVEVREMDQSHGAGQAG